MLIDQYETEDIVVSSGSNSMVIFKLWLFSHYYKSPGKFFPKQNISRQLTQTNLIKETLQKSKSSIDEITINPGIYFKKLFFH